MMGNPPAVAAAAVAGEGKRHTVDSGRLLGEAEAEVHHHSILGMVVVDVRAVVEVFGEGMDTKVVSSGEVGIQTSAGIGSAVVAALGADTDRAGEEAGEKTQFVAVENTCSEGVVVGWESKMATLYCFPTFLTQRMDREWGSVVVGVVGCTVGVVVSVEAMETVLARIGLGFPQGLAGRTAFEKVQAKVGAGECS